MNSDIGFRGNPKLKKTNSMVEWTPDLVQEWMKCSEDPIYFIETYMKIISKGKLASFKLYEWQKDVILSYKNNTRTILASCRQGGKSTTTVGFILWFVLFHSFKTVAILANKADVAQEMLVRIQFSYENLPSWLQQGIVSGGWNKTSITLENNSRVFSAATSKDSISGFTIDFLMVDEVSKIENWEEFWTASSMTLSNNPDAKLAMISTPLGLNHFYEFWDGAVNGVNGFNPIKVTWRMIPGRDEAWKQATLADLNFDQQKFEQEHEVEFIGSSGTLIAGWKLQQLKDLHPLHRENGLSKYHSPIEGHIYVMVCDVSRGKGLDYSAFSVIDITTMPFEQVCTFRNNMITPTDYAEIIYHVGCTYNDAYILVEINDIGGQVSDILFNEYEYENLFRTEHAGRAGKRVSFGSGNKTDLGIRTTQPVRNLGCSLIKLLIEQNKLNINDKDTINEFNTFSKKNNKYQAEPGKTDDLVIGLVLFAWLSDQSFFSELNNINTLSQLRDKTEGEIIDDMIAFGFYDDGTKEMHEFDDITDYPTVNWEIYK